MTDPTAIPVNLFENDRELIVVAPMPGVAPEDITIDVTDAGRLTLRAAQHGEGQDRIDYVTREWCIRSIRADASTCPPWSMRRARTSRSATACLSVTLPKAGAMGAGRMGVQRTGHARGVGCRARRDARRRGRRPDPR